MNFDDCFDRLLKAEGGYSYRPGDADPGGETKFGISKRSYPDEDIKNLTEDRARFLARRDYWSRIPSIDSLPAHIRYAVFETAFWSGLSASITNLQRACESVPDGILGPKTLEACARYAPPALCLRFWAYRLLFLSRLPNYSHNPGWFNRIASNLLADAAVFSSPVPRSGGDQSDPGLPAPQNPV